jgi:DNA-binding GntR family transcriptional regulator
MGGRERVRNEARTLRDNAGMSLPRLESIERSTLWDRAYVALKSALLAGKFAPGERVVLRQVADDLGISLTPVRDAVNRLIAERVLERGGLGPAGAAVVPLLDEDQFKQLMTVRAGLEPVAAAAAAARAKPGQVDRVEACLSEMRRAVEAQDTAKYLEAHYQFHFGIYRLCEMPIVEEIIESAWLRCAPTLKLALPRNIPSLKRFGAHVETVAALRRHDGAAAAAAIRGDIESAREDIGAMLRERDAPGTASAGS